MFVLLRVGETNILPDLTILWRTIPLSYRDSIYQLLQYTQLIMSITLLISPGKIKDELIQQTRGGQLQLSTIPI